MEAKLPNEIWNRIKDLVPPELKSAGKKGYRKYNITFGSGGVIRCCICDKEKPFTKEFFECKRSYRCKKCACEIKKSAGYNTHLNYLPVDVRRKLFMLAKNPETVCEVCGVGQPICVDHCHETRTVRGFLCKPCNLAMGYMRDNPEFIKRLAQYAEKSYSMDKSQWFISTHKGLKKITDI